MGAEASADLARSHGRERPLGFVLNVASGHVEPDGVGVDMIEGIGRGDVLPAASEGCYEFHLKMVIGGAGRIGMVYCIRARDDLKRVRRFHEEERRLALGVLPHFAGMGGVVASHAIDAAHREKVLAANNGQGGTGWVRDHGQHRLGASSGFALIGCGTAPCPAKTGHEPYHRR